jgi:hypothetical protein
MLGVSAFAAAPALAEFVAQLLANFPGTLAAAGSYAQLVAQIGKTGGAHGYGRRDLAISNGVADTDIHGGCS